MFVRRAVAVFVLACCATPACSSGPKPPPPPPCDDACKDGVALRATREMMKLVFNLTFQGKPVGSYDKTIPCIRGGKARIFGNATSNAVQGATDVDLTFVFEQCAYLQKDTDPKNVYDMTVTGTITEKGTLAVQPTSTTALVIQSDAVTLDGTVYDPPEPYEATSCPLDVLQDGGHVGGTMCGRQVGFVF